MINKVVEQRNSERRSSTRRKKDEDDFFIDRRERDRRRYVERRVKLSKEASLIIKKNKEFIEKKQVMIFLISFVLGGVFASFGAYIVNYILFYFGFSLMILALIFSMSIKNLLDRRLQNQLEKDKKRNKHG